MAEVNTDSGGGDKGGKKRAKKSSTRIDMTPMVDLAFLLLTFFILTATFNKQKVMSVPYPKEDKDPKQQKKTETKMVLHFYVERTIRFFIT